MNNPLTRGVVEYFRGEEARCLVNIHGLPLPVSLPSLVLRRHGLTENMHFEWRMQADGAVCEHDIRPLPGPHLSDEERRGLERRYQEDMEDPGPEVWDAPKPRRSP